LIIRVIMNYILDIRAGFNYAVNNVHNLIIDGINNYFTLQFR
jgi:hypothetical protein